MQDFLLDVALELQLVRPKQTGVWANLSSLCALATVYDQVQI